MIDYQLLRERLVGLIVEAAGALDFVGQTAVTGWRPDLDEVEHYYDRLHTAYRRIDDEWDRLVYNNLQKEDRQ